MYVTFSVFDCKIIFLTQKEEEKDDNTERKKKLGQCEINTVSGRHLSAMYVYGLLVIAFFFCARIVLAISFMLMIIKYGYNRVPYAYMQTFSFLSLAATEINDCSQNAIKIHTLQMQMILPRVSVIFPAGNFR